MVMMTMMILLRIKIEEEQGMEAAADSCKVKKEDIFIICYPPNFLWNSTFAGLQAAHPREKACFWR